MGVHEGKKQKIAPMEANSKLEEDSDFPKIIQLNVGGHHYTTTHLTLIKCPDNMLSAMFSGNYSVVKDEEGRYFIDADGSNFIHILNYLRYGDVPPPELAETVYREAAYFGIYGLVRELEKYPSILSQIQRSNFRNNFAGYLECLDTLINTASKSAIKTTSEVKLLIFKSENKYQDEEFNVNHLCVGETLNDKKPFSPDAKLGPWKQEDNERELVNCFMFDLESRGFTVTSRFHSQCTYKVNESRCQKNFYFLTFYWWRK